MEDIIAIVTINSISPHDLGVNHNEWRPNQYEAYKTVNDLNSNGGGFIFASMPTGTGKSAIATALGYDNDVLVICHTLALLEQYRDNYDFDIVKGRQEYPCVLTKKVDIWQKKFKTTPTAADCHFDPMHKCPVAQQCPYIIAKDTATNSQKAACTYRYVGVSRPMQDRTGILVMDEAHDAVEELIKMNEFVITFKTIRRLRMPPFHLWEFGKDNKGAVMSDNTIIATQAWLRLGLKQAKTDQYSRDVKTIQRLGRFKNRLDENKWFLKIKKDRILFRALDAKSVAQRVFQSKSTVLLMSATIGDPKPLAKSLGIEKYDTLSTPHPILKKYRRVHDLGMPSLSARNLKQYPEYYRLQAEAIWAWINKFPPSWRGLIVTTSFKKIKELKRHLGKINSKTMIKRRLIVQENGERPKEMVQRFLNDRENGDIAIGTIQGWGTGLDLQGQIARWIVIAGVPHQNPTDEYAKARRRIEGGIKYQLWVTYNAVPQAAGRVSRGMLDENGDPFSNFAALADGSAMTKTALKYYPLWFRDAIR